MFGTIKRIRFLFVSAQPITPLYNKHQVCTYQNPFTILTTLAIYLHPDYIIICISFHSSFIFLLPLEHTLPERIARDKLKRKNCSLICPPCRLGSVQRDGK